MQGAKNPVHSEERHDVRGDGRIILYKRPGLKNPKWQVRLRVPGANQYKVVSSKSAKLSVAEAFANDLYDRLYLQVKAGGSIRSKTFSQIFHDWEMSDQSMRQKHQADAVSGTVERVRTYALQFFGAMKIDEIKSQDFQKFWQWRQENYSRVRPSNNTLGRERTAILAVFRFAEKFGHISNIPDSAAPKSKLQRRPSFTENEWNNITKSMDSWEKDGENKSIWRDRYVAKRYFQILANSGIRVGELRKLKWTDLRQLDSDEGTFVVAEVRGKTGIREVVCQKGTGKFFNEMLQLQRKELLKTSKNQPSSSKKFIDRFVFCHPNGMPIKTFKRSFQSLLKFANVTIERNGMSRTIYSLRHLYATNRLYEDVSPFHLARQMGTSVDMIDKFYGQTVNSQAAAQITKTRKVTVTPFKATFESFED